MTALLSASAQAIETEVQDSGASIMPRIFDALTDRDSLREVLNRQAIDPHLTDQVSGYGPVIVPQLEEIALEGSRLAASNEAASILQKLDPYAAERVYLEAFTSPARHEMLLAQGARFLMERNSPRIHAALREAFFNPEIDETVRISIGGLESSVFSLQDQTRLLSLVQSQKSSDDLSIAAMFQLHQSNLTTAEVRQHLLHTAQNDSRTPVRESALSILGELPFGDVLEGLGRLAGSAELRKQDRTDELELTIYAAINCGCAQNRSGEVVQLITGLAGDSTLDNSVRRNIIKALSGLEERYVAGAFRSLADDRTLSLDLRLTAIAGLTPYCPQEGLLKLEGILTAAHKSSEGAAFDEVAQVLRAAGGTRKAISAFSSRLSGERLLDMLRSAVMQEGVSEIDYSMMSEAAGLLIEVDRDPALQAIERVLFSGKVSEGRPELRYWEGNYGSSIWQWTSAIEALKSCPDEKALAILRRAIQTDEPVVRIRAAAALVEAEPDLAFSVLGTIENSGLYAPSIAEGLLRIGTKEAMKQLFSILIDKDTFQREEVQSVVGSLLNSNEKILDFAVRLMEAGTLPGEEKESLKIRAYAEALLATPELGIEYPLRLEPDALVEAVRNRLHAPAEFDARPVALVIFPRNDANSAFYQASPALSEIISSGCRLMYFEAENDDTLIEALRCGTSYENQEWSCPADLLILGAHGFKQGMSFGAADPQVSGISDEAAMLDLGDEERLAQAGVDRALAPGGTVILWSCSTGAGRDEAGSSDNVANMIRRLFPQAGEEKIISPIAPAEFRELRYRASQIPDDVRFSVPNYYTQLDEERTIIKAA